MVAEGVAEGLTYSQAVAARPELVSGPPRLGAYCHGNAVSVHHAQPLLVQGVPLPWVLVPKYRGTLSRNVAFYRLCFVTDVTQAELRDAERQVYLAQERYRE